MCSSGPFYGEWGHRKQQWCHQHITRKDKNKAGWVDWLEHFTQRRFRDSFMTFLSNGNFMWWLKKSGKQQEVRAQEEQQPLRLTIRYLICEILKMAFVTLFSKNKLTSFTICPHKTASRMSSTVWTYIYLVMILTRRSRIRNLHRRAACSVSLYISHNSVFKFLY